MKSPSPRTHGQLVEGVIIHGDKRGRLLGFPTANMSATDVLVSDGVWAGTIRFAHRPDDSFLPAAISVGSRPTYYGADSERLIEVHILNFDADVYGEKARVQFHRRLRPQREFTDSAELVSQIHQDVSDVRTWAMRKGLLIATTPAPPRRAGRWGPTWRKRSIDRSDRSEGRELRRTELVVQAVLACPPRLLSHGWVAEWTGLPEGYLRHTYPTIEALVAAAPGRVTD